jgi:catalase
MKSFNMRASWALLLAGIASAACPYGDSGRDMEERAEIPGSILKGRETQTDAQFLKQFTVDDSDTYLTSDVGGRFADDHSLKAGERGPTLLEDFIFRQKIQHFDHERVYILIAH